MYSPPGSPHSSQVRLLSHSVARIASTNSLTRFMSSTRSLVPESLRHVAAILESA